MANIEFGLMLQPKPLDFPARELFDYNRRLIRALAPGFTTLWAEDHLQLGEIATIECLTTLAYFAAEFPAFRVGSLVMLISLSRFPQSRIAQGCPWKYTVSRGS